MSSVCRRKEEYVPSITDTATRRASASILFQPLLKSSFSLLHLIFIFLFLLTPLFSLFLSPPTHDLISRYQKMKRRSPLASFPRLLSSLAITLNPLLSAEGPSHAVQTFTSTVVAPLDAVAMETLCADQIGTCMVSCQSKILENSW